MSFQLRNQRNPHQTICLNALSWYGILELAERYGWNPMGAIRSGQQEADFSTLYGDFEGLTSGEINYWDGEQLVLIDDALNLADALKLAFQDYEPVRLPSLYYFTRFNGNMELDRKFIGLGTLQQMLHFCQLGAFFIEKI